VNTKRSKHLKNALFDVSGIKIAVDHTIADAGATSHFLLPGAPVSDIKKATTPLTIHLPDGTTIQSTNTYLLRRPDLPRAARVAHIVPGLSHSSLISIKVLCDAGCKITYDGDHCDVAYRNKTIWTGVREPSTGLWVLPLNPDATRKLTTSTTPPRQMANNVYQMTLKEALVRFLHQCLFLPPKQTLIKALDNGQLPTWPLTKEAVVKHLPDHSPATDKGSMKRQRQGLRST
jgi:hypothetical protein